MTPRAEPQLVAVLERIAIALEARAARVDAPGVGPTIDTVVSTERVQTVAQLSVDEAGLARLLDLPESTIRELDAEDLIPSAVELHGTKRWGIEEVRAWLKAGAPQRGSWRSMREVRLWPFR